MQSQSFANRYLTMRREKIAHGWTLAKRNRGCYLFLAPYAILFFMFFILPIGTSICLSFTYYNMLEPPRFIGFQNYINLVLQDEVFLTAIKNTFVAAVIVGPVGYILSFLFAWFINELPKWLRAVAVIIFYAPSIGGAAFQVFAIIFRGDNYGWFNSILMELGIISEPYLWLTDPRYMMTIVIIVRGRLPGHRPEHVRSRLCGRRSQSLAGTVPHYPAEYEADAAVRRGHEHHFLFQHQRRAAGSVRLSFHGLRGPHGGYPSFRLRLQPVRDGLRQRHRNNSVPDHDSEQKSNCRIAGKGGYLR